MSRNRCYEGPVRLGRRQHQLGDLGEVRNELTVSFRMKAMRLGDIA